jgi:hypothetical protein
MSLRNRSFKFDNKLKQLLVGGVVVQDQSGGNTTAITDALEVNTIDLTASGTATIGQIELDGQTIRNSVSGYNLVLSAQGSGIVQVLDTLSATNITVTGNLDVQGTTTTIDSTNTTITDSLILLADGTSGAPTKDAGLIVERGSQINVGILWDESADQFVLATTSDDATTVGDVEITAYANMQVNNLKLADLQYANGTSILTTINSTIDGDITTANTNLKGYTDGAISTANVNLKGYSDATFASGSAITTANTNLKGYTDGEITTVTSAITTANVNLKGYVDSEITAIGAHYSNTDVAAYLTTNNYATESYADTANVNLKGYSDATFETQSSATTANTNVVGYVDGEVTTLNSAITTANTNVVGYIDGEVTTLNSTITTANTNVVGYVDDAVSTANVNLKGYADATFLTSFTETNDLTSAVTWANIPDANVPESAVTQHQSALTITESQISDLGTYATTSDLTTANTNVVGYVDGEITTVNSTITTANTNVVGYVDSAVTTANVNLKGYVDAGNTNVVGYIDNAVTTANTNLKGYADATFLTSYTETNDLSASVTWANIPDANVPQSAVTQHQSALSITESQISDLGTYATTSALTTANTNMGGYVDNAVSTANVNLKGYADDTFAQQTLTADLDGADTYGIINLVDPTSAQDAVTLAYLESSLSSDVTAILNDDTSVEVNDNGVNPGNIGFVVDDSIVGNITASGLTLTGSVETGAISVTNTSLDDSILITTTEDSSTAGPVLTLKRNSSSPADGDYLGQIKFKGENDADEEVVYSEITGKVLDASDGTEDGILEFAFTKGGSNNVSARFRSDSLQLINGTTLTVNGLISTASTITATSDIETTGGDVNIKARGELKFYDADSSNYVSLRAGSIVASDIVFTLPVQDGTSGQVLQTDGSRNLSFVTASGGGGASGYQTSTITTHPSAGGDDKSLGTGADNVTEETPFEAGGTDPFGVSLGIVYDQMEPIGSFVTIDLGDEEAHVGA